MGGHSAQSVQVLMTSQDHTSDTRAAAARLDLHITSDGEELAVVREHGLDMAQRIGFGEEDARRIVLALDEALANVIQHGYGGASGLPIHIVIEPWQEGSRRGIRVVICDEGKQVEPKQICGRDLDDIRPGGLGVYLMNAIMDKVEHSKRDRGMRLEMVKFLSVGLSRSGPDS